VTKLLEETTPRIPTGTSPLVCLRVALSNISAQSLKRSVAAAFKATTITTPQLYGGQADVKQNNHEHKQKLGVKMVRSGKFIKLFRLHLKL
jgi:hypothetical protein